VSVVSLLDLDLERNRFSEIETGFGFCFAVEMVSMVVECKQASRRVTRRDSNDGLAGRCVTERRKQLAAILRSCVIFTRISHVFSSRLAQVNKQQVNGLRFRQRNISRAGFAS